MILVLGEQRADLLHVDRVVERRRIADLAFVCGQLKVQVCVCGLHSNASWGEACSPCLGGTQLNVRSSYATAPRAD